MGTTMVKSASLFEQKRLRGFWPVYNEVNGERELTVSFVNYCNFPRAFGQTGLDKQADPDKTALGAV